MVMRFVCLLALFSSGAACTAKHGSSVVPPAGGGNGGSGGGGSGGSGGSAGSAGSGGAGGGPSGVDAGGPVAIPPGEMDTPSDGATITFESIGAPGWFPSRRDPASGTCDAYQSSTCCLAKYQVSGDQLTPWDEDLILTLRGPMMVKQLVTYQPDPANAGQWALVSSWSADASAGIAFEGNGTEKSGFPGSVGTECLVNVSTSREFMCGAGSTPYCPPPGTGHKAYYGWPGSKLFVLLASMPHAGSVPGACSTTTTGGWYDAPWIGLNHGELVRAGSFSSCNCFAKDPSKWYLADGCGQFNVFEVVNDNNQYRNFDVFSTNMIGYAGYVGEGPCGSQCNVSGLAPTVDLINKSTSTEASAGAVATPTKGPGAAFRRPENGYRYFIILMDVSSRTAQLALVHPAHIPTSLAGLLPATPSSIDAQVIDNLLALRLPR
jgi:hypothetical protein